MTARVITTTDISPDNKADIESDNAAYLDPGGQQIDSSSLVSRAVSGPSARGPFSSGPVSISHTTPTTEFCSATIPPPMIWKNTAWSPLSPVPVSTSDTTPTTEFCSTNVPPPMIWKKHPTKMHAKKFSSAAPPSLKPPPPMMDPKMIAVQQASVTSFHSEVSFCGPCSGPPGTEAASSPISRNSTKETFAYCQQKKEHSESADSSDDDIGDSSDGCSSSDDDEKRTLNRNTNRKFNRTRLFLSGEKLSSSSHELLIQSLIKPIKGVHKVVVSLEKSEIRIDHDANVKQDRLASVLEQGGYPTTKLEASTSTHPASNNTSITPAVASGSYSNNDDRKTCTIVKSQFLVNGICCYSEVPSVRKICKSIPGVDKLQFNITTKMVYIHYDSITVSADCIAQKLTDEGFPARVVKDGSRSNSTFNTARGQGQSQAQLSPSSNDAVGRSILHVKGNILTAKHVSPIQHIFANLPGVTKVGVNVSESMIFVEHDVSKLSASELAQTPGPTDEFKFFVAKDAKEEFQERQLQLFSQPKSQYVESTLFVPNLTDFQKADIIQKVIKQKTMKLQVRATYPHVTSRTLKVEHNPDLLPIQTLLPTLENAGIHAQVLIDGEAEQLVLPLQEDCVLMESVNKKNGLGGLLTSKSHFNVILSGIFWFVSMLGAIEEWQSLKYAGLLAVFFGLPPVALKAWRTVRRRQFDANCMMVIAAFGAVALGEFDEAASVSFLFAVSELLEERSTLKARIALDAIVNLRPDHASVINPATKEISVVPVEQIPVGSLVSVRTGDKVAADGIVVEGSSSLDESSLTGESVPILKNAGDSVSGGSINIGTVQLVVRTTSSVEDSAVSRLIQLIEEAQANRSPTEKMIDTFARSYTPFVVFMAAVMCTIPWFFGPEVGRYWTLNGLIIIVIACPCALTISTPVTYAAGLAAMAQRGIIVKGGARLEALGAVGTVLLDKTGTLTQGRFSVIHLENIGETRSRKEMLELLALMEAPSSHPLSTTLVKATKEEGVTIPSNTTVLQHTILQGEGVTATVDGKQVYVGNKRLFVRIGMYEQLPQKWKDLADQWNGKGETVGFLGVDGEGIIGSFSMVDAIRPEAKGVIDSLHASGINVMMLTGDNDGAAKTISKEIGLDASKVYSQLLPEDKLQFVGGLINSRDETTRNASRFPFFQSTSKSNVLFCGDGVNDGPALAVADVGVSMGQGAALAMEMSDVTLMDSNLSKLVYAIKMGTRVVKTIRENIFFSFAAKFLVIVLTFAGQMTLFMAIASDVGVMLVVTLNGMKLLPGRKQENTNDDTHNDVEEGTGSFMRKLFKSKLFYDQVPSTAGIDMRTKDTESVDYDPELV